MSSFFVKMLPKDHGSCTHQYCLEHRAIWGRECQSEKRKNKDFIINLHLLAISSHFSRLQYSSTVGHYGILFFRNAGNKWLPLVFIWLEPGVIFKIFNNQYPTLNHLKRCRPQDSASYWMSPASLELNPLVAGLVGSGGGSTGRLRRLVLPLQDWKLGDSSQTDLANNLNTARWYSLTNIISSHQKKLARQVLSIVCRYGHNVSGTLNNWLQVTQLVHNRTKAQDTQADALSLLQYRILLWKKEIKGWCFPLRGSRFMT